MWGTKVVLSLLVAMAVNLHTTHFRFGIDELAEDTHGWHAAEDVNPAQGVIAVDTTFLLRFTVQETGGTAAANTDQQFQCRKNTDPWQDITTTSTIAKAVAAIPFTNGQACTKRLSGTGTFEVSGAGCTEDGLSGGAPNDIAASGNSETECGLQMVGADVAGNDVIEFRLTSPDFTITNDVVPSITVAGATTLAPSAIASAEVFGSAKELLTLPVGAIPSAEAFGSLTTALRLIASAIASAEAIGTHSIAEAQDILSPTGIPSAEAFGTAKEVLTLVATALVSAEAVGAPRPVMVTFPGGIATAEIVGSHALLSVIRTNGIVSDEAFGTASIPWMVLASSIPSAEAFGNLARPKRTLIGEDWSSAAAVIIND